MLRLQRDDVGVKKGRSERPLDLMLGEVCVLGGEKLFNMLDLVEVDTWDAHDEQANLAWQLTVDLEIAE